MRRLPLVAAVSSYIGCTEPDAPADAPSVASAGYENGSVSQREPRPESEAESTTPTIDPDGRDRADRLAAGPVVRRAAFVREGIDGGPRPDARGGPALEIVALGQDFAVRAVNYSDKEQWLALADVEPGRRVDKLVSLTSLVQFASAQMRDCEPGLSTTDRVRRPTLLRLPPGATIDLGRGRAYVADGVDASWPRVVFADSWCLDSPGGYGRVLAQWASPTPVTSPAPPPDVPAVSFHVASVDDEPSNFADIYPEYARTDVDPNAPPKERLPMPADLRETARELGLE